MTDQLTPISPAHPLATFLAPHQHTLPTNRQSAVVIKKLELALAPYPAYFREIQQNLIEELRESHPELADEVDNALAAAQQAIEHHCHGLRLVNQLLNNHD